MKSKLMLSPWQKKQAALLYKFASIEYLKGLKKRVDDLISTAETGLRSAAQEERDTLLSSINWGERDTAENWANNAWPFLADFQLSIAKDLANRAVESYNITGANQCGRGLAEFSMLWSTPTEQATFEEMFAALSLYARNIDQTMNKSGKTSKWHDYGLTLAWKNNNSQFIQLPQFRLREDVVCESGRVPIRTGVYVCLDDPNASLQFAWIGGDGGKLLESNTLNELGRSALLKAGRRDLWVNGNVMLEFVKENLTNPSLVSDPYFDESQTPELAPTLVARNAFMSSSSRWTFIELLNDEFEPIEIEAHESSGVSFKPRFEAGQPCTQAGFYFTPARPDSSHHFQVGEFFPEIRSHYGATIWQWDDKQD